MIWATTTPVLSVSLGLVIVCFASQNKWVSRPVELWVGTFVYHISPLHFVYSGCLSRFINNIVSFSSDVTSILKQCIGGAKLLVLLCITFVWYVILFCYAKKIHCNTVL